MLLVTEFISLYRIPHNIVADPEEKVGGLKSSDIQFTSIPVLLPTDKRSDAADTVPMPR